LKNAGFACSIFTAKINKSDLFSGQKELVHPGLLWGEAESAAAAEDSSDETLSVSEARASSFNGHLFSVYSFNEGIGDSICVQMLTKPGLAPDGPGVFLQILQVRGLPVPVLKCTQLVLSVLQAFLD
jgi:hypothetical protein